MGVGFAGAVATVIDYAIKPALFEGVIGNLMRWDSVFDRFSPFTNAVGVGRGG